MVTIKHGLGSGRVLVKVAWVVLVWILIAIIHKSSSGFDVVHIATNLKPQQQQQQPQQQQVRTEPQQILKPTTGECKIEDGRLQELKNKYGLGHEPQLLRRHVHVTRQHGLVRKSMTKLPQRLLTDDIASQGLETPENQQNDREKCAPPLKVSVSASGLPSTVNASALIFGVSTTYKRFKNSETNPTHEWIYWLTDGHGHSNGGRLILTLLDASSAELSQTEQALREVGIDATVVASDSQATMAMRYLQLVPVVFNSLGLTATTLAESRRRWVILCDDDTFFPNMHALVDRLAGLDSTREYYIGTLSEDAGSLWRHGSQAYGGAGTFLSLPLAAKLSGVFAECTAPEIRSHIEQGDMMLRSCIDKHTTTQLTTWSDLWQLDITHDPSGFYEAGFHPLSLHHYHSWHHAKPAEMAKIAHICGEDCILQRFQTVDDFIISGYSIAQYPAGIDFDVNQVERTLRPPQDDNGWNFDYRFGPQRLALERTGRKLAWELQDTEILPSGSLLQTYVFRANDSRWTDVDGEPLRNHDSVFELVWSLNGAETR